MHKLFILFSIAFILSSFDAGLHKYYVSRCMVEYKQDQKAIQVSMHLFIDDLEEALKERGVDQLFICTKKETADADEHIFNYLKEHFVIITDGTPQQYDYIGKEVSEDLAGVWIYLEVTDVEIIEEMTIKDNILMELFEDQKNIVSVKVPGKKESYFLFSTGDYEDKVTF